MARQLFYGSIEVEGGAEVFVLAGDAAEAKKLLEREDLSSYCDPRYVAGVGEPIDVEDENEWDRDRRRRVIGMPREARYRRDTVADAVELILGEREEEAEAERRKDVPGTDEYRAIQEEGDPVLGRQRRIFAAGGGADAAPAAT